MIWTVRRRLVPCLRWQTFEILLFNKYWKVVGYFTKTVSTAGILFDDCTVPHRTAPHRTAPHRTAPHRTAPHRTAPHRTAPHRTVPYRTVPYRTAPYHTVLCCTVRRRECACFDPEKEPLHGTVKLEGGEEGSSHIRCLWGASAL